MLLKEFFLCENNEVEFSDALERFVGKVKNLLKKMYNGDELAAEVAARTLLVQVGEKGANKLYTELANMSGTKRLEYVRTALKNAAPVSVKPKEHIKTAKVTPATQKKTQQATKENPPEDDDVDIEKLYADYAPKEDATEYQLPKVTLPNDDDLGPEEPEFSPPESHKRVSSSEDNTPLDYMFDPDPKKDRAVWKEKEEKIRADLIKKTAKSFKDMTPEQQEKMRQLYGSGPSMKQTYGLKPTGKSKNIGPSY